MKSGDNLPSQASCLTFFWMII